MAGLGLASETATKKPVAPQDVDAVSAKTAAGIPTPVVGYHLEGLASGVPLRGYAGPYNAKQKGVVQGFNPHLSELVGLPVGAKVEFALPFGAVATGTVSTAQRDTEGVFHYAGTLEANGYFLVSASSQTMTGYLVFSKDRMAYTLEVDTEEDGSAEHIIVERRMESVICDVIPLVEPPRPAAAIGGQTTIVFNSMPQAQAVIYIDFEGGVIDDPWWTAFTGGQSIVAKPQGQTPAAMLEIAQRVAEDFAPFNINVTTERSRYDAAPSNRRMRCIVTATNFLGAGGVAYLDSFGQRAPSGAGRVCWAFNGGIQTCAVTISHEVGHTFGLNHDGRNLSTGPEEYYGGHGNWGPLMGTPFNRSIEQWSNGDYRDANTKEDDLAVIAGVRWGFGFKTDEAGETRAAAAALQVQGGLISQTGFISRSTDVDYYVFSTAGGTVSVTASPAAVGPNLDTQLALEDSKGTVLASSLIQDSLSSSVTAFLQPGQYFLRIQGAGNRDPLKDGYSSYGSVGAYQITGKIAADSGVPVIVSSGTASGHIGSMFNYAIAATNNPTAFAVQGVLPSNLSLDPASGIISGKLQQIGSFTVTMFAANGVGPGSKVLTIVSNPALKTLAEAINQPALQVTSDGNAPWFVDSTKASDGVASASSGKISNGQSSRMRVAIPGPVAVSFKWAVSSEAADALQLWVNGIQRAETTSGERDWQTVSLELPGASNFLEWRYVKDANISGGQDSAWVDELKIGAPPRILTPPADLTVDAGDNASFTVSAFGATSYKWSKNGMDLPGQTGATLTVNRAAAADEGQYVVTVRNAYGEVPATARLKVVGGVTITQQPQDTIVSEERSVTLYLRASGGTAANPLTVTWMRDGKEVKAALSDAAAKWGVPPYAYSVSSYSDPTSQGLYILSLSRAYLFAEGEYYAEVKSGASTVTSLKAKLQVNPVLNQVPADLTIRAGGAGVLTFETPTTAFQAGPYPAKILWFKGAGSTASLSDFDNNASFSINNAKESDSGAYYISIASLNGIVRSPLLAVNLLVASAPVITTHPVSTSVLSGANASFSVTVTGGTPPLSYQWWFQDGQGGAAVRVGGNAPLLNIPLAQTAQAGSYWVEVGYPAGKVTSQKATLAVKAPDLPTVMAAGPVFNGVRIPFVWSPEVGGWVSTSEITQAQFKAVTGLSPSLFQGVNRPVENLTQKQAASFCQRITTLGTTQKWLPKTWQFVLPSDAEWAAVVNGVPAAGEIFGRTSQQGTAEVNSGGVSDAGLYGSMGNVAEWGRSLSTGGRSVLGGAWDSATLTGIPTPASRLPETSRSNRVGFRVYLLYSPEQQPLAITAQPKALTVNEGASVRFSVTAAGGSPPYRYQWMKDGIEIPGAILPQLTFQKANLSNVGVYSVAVSAGKSRVLSADAALTVNGVPPPTGLDAVMDRQPVFEGVRIEFAKLAALKGWVGLTEVTQGQFLQLMGYNPSQFVDLDKPVENVSWNEAFAFCDKLNAAARFAKWLPSNWAFTMPSEPEYAYLLARTDSSTAVLGRRVEEGPAKTRTLAANSDKLFDVMGNVREWCRNWTDGSKLFKGQSGGSCLAGEDPGARRIQVPSLRQPYTGFRVALFSVQPDTATPPQLTRVPAPQKGKTGGTITLSGAATGSPPLSFQWLKDGVPIAGATQSSLRISPLRGSSAGSYQLRVTNPAGMATSPGALVEVESGASLDTLKVRLATAVNIGPASFKFETVPAINGWAMASEVSQDQYARIMGSNPSTAKGGDLPVHNLRWENALAFCGRLNSIGTDEGWLPQGWEFALPSEREWEALAGVPDFSKGWYGRSAYRPVSDGEPNARGMRNMFGNVAEWTRTWFDASMTVKSVRGGSIADAPAGLVPVDLWSRKPGSSGAQTTAGFRVVVVANPSNAEVQARLQLTPSAPGVALDSGSNLALSVKAVSSPGVVTFQWTKDGQAIPGATNASFAKPNTTIADTGDYLLLVNGVTLAGWRVSVRDPQFMQKVTALPASDQAFPMIAGNTLLVRSESDSRQSRHLASVFWPYISDSFVPQILDFRNVISVTGGTVAVTPPVVAVDGTEIRSLLTKTLGLVSVGDIDNDGEQDLVGISIDGIEVAYGEAGDALRRETIPSDGVFTANFVRHPVGIELSDFDGDGWLDIVLADFSPTNPSVGRISWMRNRSGTSFDFPEPLLDVGHVPNFSICDFNNDGRPDLLVIQTKDRSTDGVYRDSPADVYLNGGLVNGNVVLAIVPSSGISKARNVSQATAFADLDGDGNLDILTGSSDWPTASEPRVYFGNGNGTFTAGSTGFVNGPMAYHDRFAMADLELSGEPLGFWAVSYAHAPQDFGLRTWRWSVRSYADRTASVLDSFSVSPFQQQTLQATATDMDGDGAEDLLVQVWDDVAESYTSEVYRNTSRQNGRNSLLVNLRGNQSPRDGIGARIEVVASGKKQLRYVSATNTSALRFGLGAAQTAASVKVYWPSGKVTSLSNVPAGDTMVDE